MAWRVNKAAGRALLFLICLTIPLTWAAAQHGGKAQGTPVRFERGKTKATYKGQVRGSTEVEYELNAQAGQELLVRLITNPPHSTFVKMHAPNFKALQMTCLAASVEVSKKLGLASETNGRRRAFAFRLSRPRPTLIIGSYPA